MKTQRNKTRHRAGGSRRGTSAGRRGLTLIEVVAALGILSVGIVGILTLFPLGLKASQNAGDRTTAALLGRYVLEQIRFQQQTIPYDATTDDLLTELHWGSDGRVDYSFPETGPGKRDFTFEYDPGANLDHPDPPDELPDTIDGYGSGEMIVKQDASQLNDQHQYSRYEVALYVEDVEGVDLPSPPYTDGIPALKRVIVTVRWPRAFNDEARLKQQTMTFVTYIRPEKP